VVSQLSWVLPISLALGGETGIAEERLQGGKSLKWLPEKEKRSILGGEKRQDFSGKHYHLSRKRGKSVFHSLELFHGQSEDLKKTFLSGNKERGRQVRLRKAVSGSKPDLVSRLCLYAWRRILKNPLLRKDSLVFLIRPPRNLVKTQPQSQLMSLFPDLDFSPSLERLNSSGETR